MYRAISINTCGDTLNPRRTEECQSDPSVPCFFTDLGTTFGSGAGTWFGFGV